MLVNWQKEIFVIDVLTVGDKHICCDEQHSYSCPLWNCCKSGIEGCPLKEMPKEKEVPFADKLMFTTELSKEDIYNIGKAEGWNDCLNKILGGK